MESLNLPQDLHLEFVVRHNQVLTPTPGQINPYYLGFRLLEDIEKRWDNPNTEEKRDFHRPGEEGRKKIFQVRESDRDVSFIRQYLTEDLIRDMDLFVHEKRGSERVVTQVADAENWQKIREELIKGVGTASLPVIKVVDADYQGRRVLYLQHDFDGRELDLEYAEKTLKYTQQLWGYEVMLETFLDDKRHHLVHDGREFKTVRAA
jgi:stage V sporulation protein R